MVQLVVLETQYTIHNKKWHIHSTYWFILLDENMEEIYIYTRKPEWNVQHEFINKKYTIK